MASSSKNSQRVLLLGLGLAPAVSSGQCLKIQRIIQGVFNSRFFLNSTLSIGSVFKALPDDSVQQTCNKVLSRRISYLAEESNDKAAVGEILTAVRITARWYVKQTGRGAGQLLCAVNGTNPLRSVAAWNYGVKLYHTLIGDNAENSDTATAVTAGAKRKPDADGGGAAKKGSIQPFFTKSKGKGPA